MFAELLDEILVSFTLEWGQYVTMACLDIAIAAAWATALATHSVSGLGMLSGIALAVVAGVQGLTNHTLTPGSTARCLWSKFTCVNAAVGVAVMLAVWR